MDPRVKYRNVKAINYEEIQKMTEYFKSKSKTIEAKIVALSEAREQQKAEERMREMTGIWKEESIHLRAEEREANGQVRYPGYKWILEDSDTVQLLQQIEQDEDEFQKILLKPLWTLRDNIKAWMARKKDGQPIPDSSELKKLIKDMHTSVSQLTESLENEEKQYIENKEASEFDLTKFTLTSKDMGIPDEAWSWKAPNDAFLGDLLSEYIQIDVLFFNRLMALREQAELLIPASQDNWSTLEQEKVDYFWEVFQRRTRGNNKKLAVHFLTNLLENRSTPELERLIERRIMEKQFKERALVIKRSWLKAREDLSIRIQASLVQACEAAEQTRLEQKQHEAQRELCSLLREQVSRWRKQRAEIIALEEKEQAKIKAQEEVIESARKAKQAAARKATKQKVVAYKAMKQAEKAREAENEATRLAMLRDMHEKQARIDTARLVEAEKQRLLEVQRQRVLAKEQAEQEALRHQSYLDCIRSKVRPDVKSDPERIMSETRSWRIKLEERRKEAELFSEIEGTLPSRFVTQLTTFSDTQLYADRRTRLTAALHSAGLLDSDYARALLSGVASNVPTRRDNQTSEQMKQSFNPATDCK